MIQNVTTTAQAALQNEMKETTRPETAARQKSAEASDRVEKIKQAIERGEYRLDLEATARKMAEELFLGR